MPRKASPQSSDVRDAISSIVSFCEGSNISILALSRSAQVSQSALSRFIDGKRKTITPTARKCIAYVNNQHNWHNRHNVDTVGLRVVGIEGSELIENAAKSLWDGDPCTEELVASVIRTLKPTVEIMLAAIRGKTERDSL
jgi:hypothetical protein